MTKHYYLARLGGANGKLMANEEVASQTGERTKFAAMAGVLLTTAAVAAISMFFALHHAVGVSLGWSVPLALIWGVAIINIDRLLIITIGAARGRRAQMTITIMSRLVLAALIAIVVATPLVLQIFASDIAAELPIVRQQQSAQFIQNVDRGAEGKQLATVNSEIIKEQSLVNGKQSSQVTNDQATVNELNGELAADRSAENAAYAKWQCEIGGLKGGSCPSGTSGKAGNGPLARADEEAYENDKQTVTSLNQQLTAAENTLGTDDSAAAQTASNARNQLVSLEERRSNLQNMINALVTNDNHANQKDSGLLELIQALNAASAKSAGLAAARWIVTGLFFVIEVLPVLVKSLFMLGPESAYEKIVAKKSEAAIDQADLIMLAEKDVVQIEADSMRQLAALAAQNRRAIEQVRLKGELAIAAEKVTARKAIEADLTRRERETSIEANTRFSAALQRHILAAVDDWANKIQDKIERAARQQSGNGQPYSQVQQDPGYDTPSGSTL
jgi:hypothetical protein